MNRIGRKILAESKAAVVAAEKDEEKEASRNRDLLSLLVRANTAKDVPESQRLSDADVLARKSIEQHFDLALLSYSHTDYRSTYFPRRGARDVG